MNEHQPNEEQQTNQSMEEKTKLRQLFHDLRHCLHTLRVGTQLLQMAGYDKEKFGETFQLLEQDGKKAVGLVEELAEWAKDYLQENK